MSHILLFSLSGFFAEHHGLVMSIIIGLVAGLLAQVLIPGRGLGYVFTAILGIVGGYLGNMLFKDYLSFTSSEVINEIICATAGAMILCIAIGLLAGKEKKDKTAWKA